MNGDLLYLALQSLRRTPWRSLSLILGTAVACFLPLFTASTAGSIETEVLARAQASPIVLGAPGSEFDLSMASLYFRGGVPASIPFGRVAEAAEYGTAVPLVVGHSAADIPLVGTSLDYFDRRDLGLAEGRLPAVLGEAVVGASVAGERGFEIGSVVRSDLGSLYDLAGAYPMLLRIVGVLAPTGDVDDDILFTDIRTVWMLEGRVHGHREVTRPTNDEATPEPGESDNLEATAALFLFSEVDERSLESFHLHGDEGETPISSILVFPKDRRRHDQLLGEAAVRTDLQAIRPTEVVDEVLEIVLRLRSAASAYFAIVACSTAAFYLLTLSLSMRLRAEEFKLIRRIGGSRSTLIALLSLENAMILMAAMGLAMVLSGVAGRAVEIALGL